MNDFSTVLLSMNEIFKKGLDKYEDIAYRWYIISDKDTGLIKYENIEYKRYRK